MRHTLADVKYIVVPSTVLTETNIIKLSKCVIQYKIKLIYAGVSEDYSHTDLDWLFTDFYHSTQEHFGAMLNDIFIRYDVRYKWQIGIISSNGIEVDDGYQILDIKEL